MSLNVIWDYFTKSETDVSKAKLRLLNADSLITQKIVPSVMTDII